MSQRNMTREETIEDSLETCRDIYRYYRKNEDGVTEKNTAASSHISQYAAAYSAKDHTVSDKTVPMSQLMDTELADSARTVVFRNILSLIVCVLAAFVIAKLLNSFVVQSTQVEGISMEDSLHDGEHLLLDKLSYRIHAPERFDIVIFPFEEGVYYIKRIIGLPGETVLIKNGSVYINGELLQEDVYGEEEIRNPGRAEEEIVLGEGEYFVLGDNRNNSLDSRYEIVGNISEKQILGKAFLRFYPFDSIGFLNKGVQADEISGTDQK